MQLSAQHSGAIENKQLKKDIGLNFSFPAHDDLWRSHSVAIGLNARVAAILRKKWEAGLRAEFEYRFARAHGTNAELKSPASKAGFSLVALKANTQFNISSSWYCGVESGIGYVISDNDKTTGLGFIEEYDGCTQMGSCSSIYVGKYYFIHHRRTGIQLYWSNFLAERHAENFIGMRFDFSL